MHLTQNDVAKAREFNDVTETPGKVAFQWWLANEDGAGYLLMRESHHTDEDIKQAKRFLYRTQDVVQIRVASVS